MPEAPWITITQPNGATFRGCSCLAQWWPLVNLVAKKRGIIRQQVDVSQGCYNAGGVAASAGTHDGGGVLDLRQYGTDLDDLLEEAGAASFVRLPADGFSPHIHMVLVGCPHLPASAARQVDDWRAGRNALASHAPDRDQTRPATLRTWREGLAWMRNELNPPAPAISFSVFMAGVKSGKPSGNVRLVQQQLQRNGNLYRYALDGVWGPKSREAYAAYQRACGYKGAEADGIPGWTTFKRLMSWRNSYRPIP